MTSSRIAILVATMTGTAEICAQEIADALSAASLESDILLMDHLQPSTLAGHDLLIVVSSTYGHGDIPDNGKDFYQAIEASGSLAGKSFLVFGLGDMTYAATFCEGGRKWDALFAAKGAERLAPLMQHDAASGTLAEDEAAIWANGWIPRLKQVA
ncbi:flavodoxin family protein [Govanella unica]|uniref:Flavodoxin family protein n=1 Tax=Govanella unica TaxID=2975056 RepID=A0A9X3Z788_9PROT|nr:flavodoxin family protein [Govania unica]MDA5193892.1 flavodoxin family protein [Govania unica]